MEKAKKEKRKRGRPKGSAKITKKKMKILIEKLEKGASIQCSCFAAGISTSAYYEYLEKGRASRAAGSGRDVYEDFTDEVELALAKSEQALLDKVYEQINGGIKKKATKKKQALPVYHPTKPGVITGYVMMDAEESATVEDVRGDGRLAFEMLRARWPESYQRVGGKGADAPSGKKENPLGKVMFFDLDERGCIRPETASLEVTA